LELMTQGTRLDWSAWYVEVYDETGRPVLTKAFTDVRYDRRAARALREATMAMKTTFLVQTFVIKRKRLVPGDREVAPTESGALKKAEAMAGRMPGTAAIKVVADDETGELEAATILGRFGEIPDDFAEGLQNA
jgi:hypothetical protein